MTVVDAKLVALGMANESRMAKAGVKARLRSGSLSLADVMNDPPPELARALLIDVIRWTRSYGRGGRGPAIEALGRHALRDHVNLMVPLGEASQRSRTWVAEHGYYWWQAT